MTSIQIQASNGVWFPWEDYPSTDAALQRAKFYLAQDYMPPTKHILRKIKKGGRVEVKMGKFNVAFKRSEES